MNREPVPADFVGKTIVRFEASSINVWQFQFSDGSVIAIEAEPSGPMGLAEMQVCEECATF